MPTISVDVDVSLSDFTARDLVAELEGRGYTISKGGRSRLDEEEIAYQAEAAFLALRQSGGAIPEPVREFVLAAVNRIQ